MYVLQAAAEDGRADIVDVLLAEVPGADLLPEGSGWRPVHMAAVCPQRLQVGRPRVGLFGVKP